jgi:hypothetical protein
MKPSELSPQDKRALDELANPKIAKYREVLWGDDILAIPYAEPLVEGVLDLNSTALIYGESWAGKSVFALDLLMSITSGTSWMGHATEPGIGMYVVGEGLVGTRERYEAWRINHDIRNHERLAWFKSAFNLLDPDDREERRYFTELVQPKFVVLDTLARHIPGGQENDFTTISHVIEMSDWIKTATEGCCSIIGHTGKDSDKGHRGHSSLKAAVDTEICVTKGPVEDGQKSCNITVTKQKNGEGGEIGNFNLKKINLPIVPGDRPRSSVVLTQGKAIDPHESIGEVKTSELLEVCRKNSDMSESSFYRRLKALKAQGRVVEGEHGGLTLA